ncbi:transposase [Paramaledivibacter caminithermalis]|uniref:REP element-mobilizing transposase RayT n=1 Tax=Paramaledivibacter caminithermalis (strain DSM 15212 / CIP 107654 / DViRD3) TaxID=1121301 RepID=A0A1M6U457_PARC5|nr:transposase [Paramaledivibacter caminithermalis]SHK63931.1 REP element-mobilizing transposase RayT [Paramaledivibacter caminithermalis DSM 15212]
MPRTARKKSKTGINHVIFRGINHVDIFLEKDDFEEYICRLKKISTKYELEIYAYCLMGNHIHLLIKEGIEDISISLKRLGTGYAQWYNIKRQGGRKTRGRQGGRFVCLSEMVSQKNCHLDSPHSNKPTQNVMK